MNPEVKQHYMFFLKPAFVKEFACTGGDCRDNCCHHWRVSIDKDTYQSYKQVKEPKWKKRFQLHLQKTPIKRGKVDNNNYASIKLKPTGQCPFQHSSGLCKVQSELGENYLSTVCSSYPRLNTLIHDAVEKSLTPSCPEAARLALFSEDQISFDQSEEIVTVNEWKNINQKTANQNDSSYLFEIRCAAISVIQCREIGSLELRIFEMGRILDKCQKKLISQAEVAHQLSELVKNKRSDDLYQQLDLAPESQDHFSALLLTNLHRLISSTAIPRYRELATEISAALALESQAAAPTLLAARNAITNTYPALYQEHASALENYVVTYMFNHKFPQMGTDNLFNSYLRLILDFTILRYQLVGLQESKARALTQDEVIDVVYCMSRTLQHSQNFYNECLKIMNENQINTLATAVIMLKGAGVKEPEEVHA